MNDNFNTRMILTTAVFATVAALLVGPASAHVMDIEGDGGNGIGVDESQSSGQPSVELIGDTALKVDRAVAAANKAYDTYLESLRIGRYLATPLSTQGKSATAPAFPSGDELDTAISTAMATRAARESGTLSGEQQNTSDVVSRYLGNDRMGTGQFPVGYRGRP